MSSNVFPLKPARSACHVPESARPAPARAVQVPCQCGTVSLADAFTLRADHVPSRTMRLESSRSVHEPLAPSDASISAHHLPRKVPLVPAVAPHTPRSTGRDSCASAQETSRTLKTRTRRFIGTGIVPRIRIRKRRRAFTRICHSEGANHSSRQVECAC